MSTSFLSYSQDQDIDHYYGIIRAVDKDKNPYLVIENSRKIIEIDPTSKNAYYYNGDANYKLGIYWNAVSAYDKYIQLAHTNEVNVNNESGAYVNRGNAYSAMGYDNLAISDYKKAIDLSSEHWAIAHANMADTYFSNGDMPHFLENVQLAIEANPDQPSSYRLLAGYYWCEKQRFDSALYYSNEAIEIDNSNAKMYFLRGLMKKQLDYPRNEVKDDFIKAVELYSKRIKTNNQDYNALAGRAEAYYALGKKNKAREDYLQTLPFLNKLVILYPKSYRIFYSRGCIYNSLGENKKGAADFEKTLKINPKCPFVRWTLDFEKIKKQ